VQDHILSTAGDVLNTVMKPPINLRVFNPCIQVYGKLGFDEVVVIFQLVKLLLRRAFVVARVFQWFCTCAIFVAVFFLAVYGCGEDEPVG
jgi:hypothetical protein